MQALRSSARKREPLVRGVWVGAAATCALALSACNAKNAYVPPPPPKVQVAQPLQRPVTEYLELTGNTQAFASVDLVARVLIDPGDAVAIEDPNYLGARNVFLAAGAKLRPVGVDDDGARVEELRGFGSGVKLAYLTPSHQFPTGATLSL